MQLPNDNYINLAAALIALAASFVSLRHPSLKKQEKMLF